MQFKCKGGCNEWVQVLNLNQSYWALFAIGEPTGLRTWLEFPDYNMPMRCD